MAKKKTVEHFNLNEIKDPSFVMSLNNKELEILASDIRKEIVEQVSKNGGHLSSNLGATDIIVSLCNNFDFNVDKILFDVGHQSYAYKILTGRSLENLRKEGSTSGFQKRSESKYDVFEAGHSSTSISAANGMSIVRDLKGETYNIIAFIGDASIVNGLAFEGLNNASQGHHKIIIVLNDNDMSINAPIGGMSKFFRKISSATGYQSFKRSLSKLLSKTRLGGKILNGLTIFKNKIKHHLIPTTIFDNMGYNYIGPISGHNYKEMAKAFKRAKKSKKSVVVHLRTQKGKGYSPAENDKIGMWHGVPPFKVDTGEFASSNSQNWASLYADELKNIMADDKNILIDPATIQGSKLNEIYKEYRSRCFDVGIAEEHAIVMASGIALNGMHPIVSIYSTFLQRGYDEVLHDICRMNLDATLLIDHAGLVGADGETHQGIFDEDILYSLPNTVIAMASTKEQIPSLMEESNKDGHGLFCIRYPKDRIKETKCSSNSTEFGKWELINNPDNKDIAVVGVGENVRLLADLIKESGKEVSVIDAIYQKPMDEDMIKLLLSYRKIIIYNSYAIKGGFALHLMARLNELNYKGEIIIKAIPEEFIEQASVERQLEKCNLRPIDIFKTL